MNSPAEPRWLGAAVVVAIHDESLARFGGAPGTRDRGLVESAIARPRNLYAYGGVTEIPRLAPAYGFGIARSHPFVDGNKRTALLVVAVFCTMNGRRFDPDQADEVRTIAAMSAGDVAEDAFARWVGDNCA